MRHIIYKAGIYTVGMLVLMSCGGGGSKTTTDTAYQPVAPGFNADSAYTYVAEQCAFGPRVMNTAAHDSCAIYIADKFRQFGATVTLQDAESKLYDGTPVRMRNIIASYDAANPSRILICAHWDSRPWADNDPDSQHHRTPIDGANDGASGVGVMMEMARQIQMKAPKVGIDFICFDAEDCGTPQWDETEGQSTSSTWCLGSQYWAGKRHVDGYKARYGILLDMVGGQDCIFEKEMYSMYYAPNIVDRVWAKAQRLGYGELFRNSGGGAVTDDHVQVNQSGIPCIDIIARDKDEDSFCTTWHTINDNLSNIDKRTLEAVGRTVIEVVYTEE